MKGVNVKVEWNSFLGEINLNPHSERPGLKFHLGVISGRFFNLSELAPFLRLQKIKCSAWYRGVCSKNVLGLFTLIGALQEHLSVSDFWTLL